MKGLLITGGAGFIGSHFVHHCLTQYPGSRVVVLDALTHASRLGNLKAVSNDPALRFVHGSVADERLVEELLRGEHLTTIVHFASVSHTDRSIQDPDAFVHTNVLGTHSMLKAAKRVWLDEFRAEKHRFHYVSTAEVYGSLAAGEPAFHEQAPYSPNSPYSASKAAADHLVRAYHHTYGLRVTTSNCANNYGPYHLPKKLIPLTIVNILQGRPLFVRNDGQNTQSWTHVSDHCRAINLILDRGIPGECYNIGSNSETRDLTLVQLLCRIADETVASGQHLGRRYPNCPPAKGERSARSIRFTPAPSGYDRRHAVDCEKIASKIGYRARISLEEGLRDTFDWYVQNDWWWKGATNPCYRQCIPNRGDPGSVSMDPESELLLLHRL